MTDVIVISGKSCSGKSTLSARLRPYGFGIVSAGATIASLMRGAGQEPPTRRALLNKGLEFLDPEKAEWFAGQLLLAEAGMTRLIIEGVRLTEIVGPLRLRANRLLLIYIDCCFAVRKARWTARENSDMTFEEVNAHLIEQKADEVRGSADCVLDGEKPVDDLLQEALVLIRSHSI